MMFKDWRYEERGKWRRVFAWLPVEVGYNGEMAWFQFVERRLDGWSGFGTGYSEQYSYRLKEGSPEVSKF